jgi:hypothetical protein
MSIEWPDFGPAELEQFERQLWAAEVKRRLRLVTAGETWIRTTHPSSFRTGHWALLLGMTEFRGRSCYQVRFEDGVLDYWAAGCPGWGFEFFPSRFKGLLSVLNGDGQP